MKVCITKHLKHDGTLPIIGVNTFLNPNAQDFDESAADEFDMELARATPDEKQACLERTQSITKDEEALNRLQEVARMGGNVFRRTDGNHKGCLVGTNY